MARYSLYHVDLLSIRRWQYFQPENQVIDKAPFDWDKASGFRKIKSTSNVFFCFSIKVDWNTICNGAIHWIPSKSDSMRICVVLGTVSFSCWIINWSHWQLLHFSHSSSFHHADVVFNTMFSLFVNIRFDDPFHNNLNFVQFHPNIFEL